MKFTSVPQTICQATEYWMEILQVSVSMRPYNYTNTTYVKFGVLPDPRNTSMSIESINALRTYLIKLTLQQLNLSLTPSVFGDPLCLEILGFPGGITVLLPHNASHADSIQPIFSITFDSTIREVRGFLEEMRSELALILQLTPDEVTPTLSLSCTFFSFKDLDMCKNANAGIICQVNKYKWLNGCNTSHSPSFHFPDRSQQFSTILQAETASPNHHRTAFKEPWSKYLNFWQN